METVNKKIIFISIFMALITTFLVYFYITNSTTKPQAAVEKIKVFVVNKTLPAKHKIVDGDLREEKVSKQYVNMKAVQNKSEIVGRLTKDTIIEGEQILKDRLVSNDKTSLVYSVPEGKRAISININEQIAVSNLIRPGDYVDVIANFEKEDVEDHNNKIVYPKITKTVLENILVLALGQEQNIDEAKAPESPKTVTFAVSPEEAEKLVYVSEFASLRLTLRSVGDTGVIKTQGITRTDLTSDKNSKIVPYTIDQTDSLPQQPQTQQNVKGKK
ncbi:MAG: Flp pilus assembly protein CpaB [Bacillota bacterium]|nr:Flp pilus assembly protein CpaB [Bacillota bacterium]